MLLMQIGVCSLNLKFQRQKWHKLQKANFFKGKSRISDYENIQVQRLNIYLHHQTHKWPSEKQSMHPGLTPN